MGSTLMAVNIYEELEALAKRVSALEMKLQPQMQIGPVTYFFPGTKWDETLAKNPPVVIINPGSGPGTAVSSSYVAQVGKAKAAGAKVLGYVYTDYAARAPATVKAEIDKYKAWYGVDGIFLDETSNVVAAVPYYADLSNYIRGKGGLVVLNPGTKTIEEYAGLADWIMNAECDLATYRARNGALWEAKYPDKFWHVVHTCPAADMPEVVALAKARRAALVYVTDDVMANPYDKLPTYWSQLCSEVDRVG